MEIQAIFGALAEFDAALGGEGVDRRLNQRRVKRMRHRQLLTPNAGASEARHDRENEIAIPGDHGVLRRVHGRDGDALRIALPDRLGHGRFVGEDRGHAPLRRQGLHQPRAIRHQAQAIFERVDARAIGRGELAYAMAKHGVGNDAP